MIVKCERCFKYFEDEYRSYVCPHIAFLANDGFNNFKAHTDSHLDDNPPPKTHGVVHEDGGK